MPRGDGRVYLRGNTWWLSYWLRGVQYRQSTETSDEQQARKMLKNKLKEVHADQIGARAFQTPKADRLTIHDLLESLKADYALRDKASGQNLSHLKRADEDFGTILAIALTPERVDQYIQDRLAAKDKPAAINRTLQFVRQSFTLAIRRNHLVRAPYIRRLSEKGNERKGFCEEATFRAILGFLPKYLQDFCLFGYVTGMRYGEIKSLAWANVHGDVLKLEDGDAKNGEGRIVPMVGKDLAGILTRRKEAQKVKRDDTTTIAALIFHHNGKPIVDIRKAWRTACKKAGAPNLLFHDLRRAAVRAMDEAGVSREVAKKISGHKSDSMWARYRICPDRDLRQALERTQLYREGTAGGNVVSIGK
jgi:integrase